MGLFSKSKSPQSPQPDAFAAEVLDVVRASPGIVSAHYDEADFAIVYRRGTEDKDSGRIFLQNTFRETASLSASERSNQIRRLVSIMVAAPTDTTWDEVRGSLIPVLRVVTFGAGMPMTTSGGEPVRLLTRPALPFVVEFVVVDRPDSMAYVTTARLPEWNVTEDEVFAAARENLHARAVRIDQAPPDDGKPQMIRFVDDGNGYFTSMLLVDGFLAGFAARVGGRPVAFMPDKDTLIVVSDVPAMLPGLYQLVEEQYTEATRSISPVGYTVDGSGRVVPYSAAPGSELAAVVHRSETILASTEYNSQKEALDGQHERDGIDVFAASVMVAQRPDKSLFSVAVWSDGVDTLLPEADYVAFQFDDGQAAVPFDVVVREASLLPEPDYVPTRYRVTAWPGEPVMNRLRAAAVDP